MATCRGKKCTLDQGKHLGHFKTSQGYLETKVLICTGTSAKTLVGRRGHHCLSCWWSPSLIHEACLAGKHRPPLSSQTLIFVWSNLTKLIWTEFADCLQCLKAALSGEYLIYQFFIQTKIVFQVANYPLSPLARISVVSEKHFLIVWLFCVSSLLCGSHIAAAEISRSWPKVIQAHG